MKTYLLVAAAMLALVVVPTPASAYQCVPASLDVSDELECLTANLIQCAPGEIGEACNTAGSTVDGAVDAVGDAEDLAYDAAGDAYREARRLIHYNLP